MTLKGMTLEQFQQVVEFIQEHHAFALWKSEAEYKKSREKYPKLDRYSRNIKYVDSIYDSRDQKIWYIKLRGTPIYVFRTNAALPDDFKYDNLFDWVMAYLKGEWHDPKILDECVVDYESTYSSTKNP